MLKLYYVVTKKKIIKLANHKILSNEYKNWVKKKKKTSHHFPFSLFILSSFLKPRNKGSLYLYFKRNYFIFVLLKYYSAYKVSREHSYDLCVVVYCELFIIFQSLSYTFILTTYFLIDTTFFTLYLLY
jgi:hypothetical protein